MKYVLCVHGAAGMDRWILCMRLKFFGWFAKNSTTTLNQTKLNAIALDWESTICSR